MRVVYILPEFDEHKNSFSKLLYPILKTLERSSHQFEIYSANRNYQGEFADRHHYLPTLHTPLHFLNVAVSLVVGTITMYKLRRQGKADVIHNVGCGSSLVQDVITAHASHVAWVRRKLVYREWLSLLLNPLHIYTLLVEYINYLNGRCRVIAISQGLYNHLIQYHSVLRDRIHLIPNGYYSSLIQEVHVSALSHASSYRICTASNNHKRKGLAVLLKALGLAKASGLNWHLTVYGDDRKQPIFEKLAKHYGVHEHVTFSGHVNDIIEQMANHDVFCMPSKYESFGMVYLDALVAGIPVVATEDGIYAELVEDIAELSPLSHPVQPQAVFNTLKILQQDDELRESVVKKMREKLQNYQESSMVDATLALYDEVLHEKRALIPQD